MLKTLNKHAASFKCNLRPQVLSTLSATSKMAKPLPVDLPYHSFATVDEFDTFLEENGSTMPAFYLKIAKKASGINSISADEAIEVGLCHGWIDGWGRSMDNDWYFKRYTPRRPKSIWSRKNIATVARLTQEGRMRSTGLAEVQAAQGDGRWDKAYGAAANTETPGDLAAAIAQNRVASAFFEQLDDAQRFSVVWRVQAATSEERADVIGVLVDGLRRREVPGSNGHAGSAEKDGAELAAKGKSLKKRARAEGPPENTRRSSRTRK
jgi:uncharacterized protein YdeI (YjbR/CyaY-like superfamily)